MLFLLEELLLLDELLEELLFLLELLEELLLLDELLEELLLLLLDEDELELDELLADC